MDPEKIYSFFPIWIQNILCSIEGWRIAKFRYNQKFYRLLKDLENRTFMSYDEICNFRDRRLIKFIDWSYKTVPYYRRLFKKLGAFPKDFKSIEDLEKIPVLTKSQVQDSPEDFLSERIPKNQQVTVHTSGSTGGGLRFATAKESIQEQFAIYWRFLGWHGLKPDIWRGYFGGRSVVPIDQNHPPFWRYNLPGKQIVFSGYHMSAENLQYYADEINKRRPPWLVGYPSLLSLLASYLLETGQSLGYELSGVAVSSESLLPPQIRMIKQAVGVKPIQDYGQEEGVANFSECEHGNLHVDEDFSAVEFIPLSDNNSYRVIGTNFSNLATPLIRYDTGDIVSLSKKKCECGRPGRVVKDIDGRKEDYVVLKDGTKLGRMDHVFKDLVNIREAQIHQKSPGWIEVRVVKAAKYNKNDENRMMYELRKRVGEETGISINYVKHLDRTGQGKLRFVISDVKEGMIQ